LAPGDTSPGRIANEVKRIFLKKLGGELRPTLMDLDIVEFQRLLPPGKSRITRIAKGFNEVLPEAH
jgi:hypothetical protein